MAEKKPLDINSLLKNWKAILALIAVSILVFELFAMGLLGRGSILGNVQEKQLYGETEFQGSIRTYEPFLFIPSKEALSGTMVHEIKALSGVTQLSSEATGTVIYLETRDDVYPVALALKKKNITVYSLANIAAPAEFPVLLENGQTINATGSAVAIRVETQPMIPPDSIVTIKMAVMVENNRIVQYGNALIKTENKMLSFEGEVQKQRIRQMFYIPWDERNDLDTAPLENLTFQYEKNNLAVFSVELPLEKVMAVRELDYVLYVDKKSAVFAENFTDAERAESDFGVSLAFQPSLLVVESEEGLELPYNSTSLYIYEIKLSLPDYSVPDELRVLTIESSNRITRQKVNVSATVSAVGPVMLNIENAIIASS